jgi:tryptophan synthase alpha chain
MRLQDTFKQLQKEGKKAFVAYVPFGFPSPRATQGICLTLQEAGVDAIELGIPFSDPLADGPIIQKATTESLAQGANLSNFFDTLKSLQGSLTIPLVVMTYYNPVFKYGLSSFCRKLSRLGVSAMLIVDLPVYEAGEYIRIARSFNIDTVFFITPTTSFRNMKRIARCSRGFIYYISVTGITGPRDLQFSAITGHIKSIKKITRTPVCVGFGIHTRRQVKAISAFSDGVIVGSSIVNFIEKNHHKKQFLKYLKAYISSLCTK